jgi:hypothetical protein
MTIQGDGITFWHGGISKQTVAYPGAEILFDNAALTGNPSAPTPATSDNSTSIATTAFVKAQGYLTSAPVTSVAGKVGVVTLDNTDISGLGSLAVVNDAPSDGSQYARKNAAWDVVIPGDRYLTTSTTSLAIDNANKTLTVGTGLSYTPQQDVVIAYDASKHMHAQVLTYDSGTGVMTVDVQTHTGTGTFAVWTVNVGGTVPAASIVWGDITGVLGNQTDLATALNGKLETTTAASTYFTIASAAGKANLSGATFTGKVNTTVTATTAALNIAPQATAPSSTIAGDIWIATNINYRDVNGTAKAVANTNTSNTYTAPQIIQTTVGTVNAALTQLGTGNAIQVEDSTTPDATAFVVDQFGKVGIGVAPDATAALKVDTNGIMFGDGTTQTTASPPFVFNDNPTVATLTDGTGFISSIAPNYLRVQDNVGSSMNVFAYGITFPDNTTQTTAAVSGIPDCPDDGYLYVRHFGYWAGPYTTSSFVVGGTTYYALVLVNP